MYLNWEFMHVISVFPFKNQESITSGPVSAHYKNLQSQDAPASHSVVSLTVRLSTGCHSSPYLSCCFSCRSKGRVKYSLHSFLCRKCENKRVIKKATGFKKNEDHISLWKQRRFFFLCLNNFTHFCCFSKSRVHGRCQLCSTDSQHLVEGILGVTLDRLLHLHHIQNGTDFISKQGKT